MSQKRTHYSPEFKAKVVIEALKEQKTISELAQLYQDFRPDKNNKKRPAKKKKPKPEKKVRR